jgi:hypothetical protein
MRRLPANAGGAQVQSSIAENRFVERQRWVILVGSATSRQARSRPNRDQIADVPYFSTVPIAAITGLPWLGSSS